MSENAQAPRVDPETLPTLTIKLLPDGNVSVFGPLNAPNGKLICMQMIAQAILAVETFEAPRVQVAQIVPPAGILRSN